tara:strand:+ start:926 stop:1309 length:384 start_codon:yes stop_codon:yes gene_type:complete
MKEVKLIHNKIKANEVNFTSTIELGKPKAFRYLPVASPEKEKIGLVQFVELNGYYNIQDGSFEIKYYIKSGTRIYAYQFAELLGLTLGDQLDDFERFVIESLDFDIITPDSPSQEIWRLPKNLIQNT